MPGRWLFPHIIVALIRRSVVLVPLAIAIGGNNTKIWCERYVECHRGAYNRFRGDNNRLISQSSIGSVGLCVGVPLSRLKN